MTYFTTVNLINKILISLLSFYTYALKLIYLINKLLIPLNVYSLFISSIHFYSLTVLEYTILVYDLFSANSLLITCLSKNYLYLKINHTKIQLKKCNYYFCNQNKYYYLISTYLCNLLYCFFIICKYHFMH